MEQQPSPFKPIRSFDIPSVAIQQILDNEMSFGTLKDLVLPSRRSRLTPEQQYGLTEKLKDKYGGDNRILRTMLGIATNPWIWLGAAVSPAAVESMRRSGVIFGAGRNVAFGLGYEKKGGMMQYLHALSADQALDGTLLPILMEADTLRRGHAYLVDDKIISSSLASYYKSNPHSLVELGLKEAPKNLEQWAQAVGKNIGLNRPETINAKIFNPNYKGEHERFSKAVRKFLGFELEKGYGGIDHVKGRFVPEAKVWIESEDHLKALNEIRKNNSVDGKLAGKPYKPLSWSEEGWQKVEYDVWEHLDILNKTAAERNISPGAYGDWRTRLTEGKAEIEWTSNKVMGLMDDPVREKLAKLLHIEPIRDAYRASFDRRAVMLFGDDLAHSRGDFIKADGTREFIYDEDKLSTLIAGLDPNKGKASIHNIATAEAASKGMMTAEGMDFLRAILPTEHLGKALNLKTAKKEELFKEMIKTNVSHMYRNGNYLPRNTYKDTAGKSGYRTEATGEAVEWGGRDMGVMVSQGINSAENISSLNRLAPRASSSRNLHPEDYEWLMHVNATHGGSEATAKRLQYGYDKALARIRNNADRGIATHAYTLDGVNSHLRYMKDTSEVYSRNLPHKMWDPVKKEMTADPAVWAEVIAADHRIRRGGLAAGGGSKLEDIFNLDVPLRPAKDPTIMADGRFSVEDLLGLKKGMAPNGGLTIGDLMTHQYVSMNNRWNADLFKETILPHVSSRRIPEDNIMRGLQIRMHEQLNAFANGRIGKTIEDFGPLGKNFISDIKNFTTYENLSGQLAKGLYVGFLGVNMMSVMLNMMQPLLHASMWGGLNNVLPAYKNAFLELAGYAKERFPLGLRISDAKRTELMQKHFKHVTEQGDLLGIQPSVFANIDGATYAGVQSLEKEGMGHFLAMTAPMKLFEKAELMNRLVSAHTVDNIYRKAGGINLIKRPTGVWNQDEMNFYNWMTDTRRFVREAQFGGSPLNMPTAFLGEGPAGGLLGNPLGRQFLSFLARSYTSYARTGKQISPDRYFKQGVPLLGGKRIWGGHYAADFFRVMGTGSLAYEVFKEMAHKDVSRGVGMSPMLEVMGGGWVPPVVAIPLDMVKVGMGDLEFAKSSIPGMIPGGIAFTRAMGMMPKLGDQAFLPDLASDLQKTYVDWNTSTPDGHHPVFSGDGRLVSYDKPFSIVMRGLGIDIENHPKAGEVDGYLAKQREIIVQMESEYMNALVSNNVPKAKQIEAEFLEKFKVPLKISKQQWRSRMRNLETARLERIANTIPSEYRDLYQGTIADEYKRLGFASEEEALSGTTSSQRNQAGATRTSPVRLDPATIEEIKNHLKKQEQMEKPVQEQGFNPYKSWNQ